MESENKDQGERAAGHRRFAERLRTLAADGSCGFERRAELNALAERLECLAARAEGTESTAAGMSDG